MQDTQFDLTGQTAFVTGGLGLIGRAVCKALSGAGAKAIALEPSPATKEFESMPVVEFDAAHGDDLDQRLSGLESDHGAATVWVNCAYPKTTDWGQSRPDDLDPEDWTRNVDLQLNSQCLISTAVAKRMASGAGGSIITVGSIYGTVGADFAVYDGTDMMLPPAYAAIKGGIHNYTRYLASYFGSKGVRVNAVCPGGIADGQPDRFVQNYNARVPMARMADADEIGGPVVFLASPAASYVTGTTLMVDGGWTAI